MLSLSAKGRGPVVSRCGGDSKHSKWLYRNTEFYRPSIQMHCPPQSPGNHLLCFPRLSGLKHLSFTVYIQVPNLTKVSPHQSRVWKWLLVLSPRDSRPKSELQKVRSQSIGLKLLLFLLYCNNQALPKEPLGKECIMMKN